VGYDVNGDTDEWPEEVDNDVVNRPSVVEGSEGKDRWDATYMGTQMSSRRRYTMKRAIKTGNRSEYEVKGGTGPVPPSSYAAWSPG
jgi:hypothetical protein